MGKLGFRVVLSMGALATWLAAGCSDDGSSGDGDAGEAGAAGSETSGGKTFGGAAASAGRATGGEAAGTAGAPGSSGMPMVGGSAGEGNVNEAGNGGAAGNPSESVGGAGGAGGEGGDNGVAACGANEYELVGAPGCRACTNWVYKPADGSGHETTATATYDRATSELAITPSEGFPLPKTWSFLDIGAKNGDFDPVTCPGALTYSVRGGKLVANLSSLVQCGAAHVVLEGFALDYGCAGGLTNFNSVDVALTGDEFVGPAIFGEDLGPVKRLVPAAPVPPFVGAAAPSTCTAEQYREAGYADCRACGAWHYSGADLSCRIFGTHHVFHPETGEVVIEPGRELPLPIDWTLTAAPILFHTDSNVVLPACTATIDTFVRDGLLIADVSEFQDCVAALPPGAGLDFGGSTTQVDYGCAGGGVATQSFSIMLTGGDGSVTSTCLSDEDWPPVHYD